MSILSVDNMSPIGSGTTVTVNKSVTLESGNTNITGVCTATTFSGAVSGTTGTFSALTVSGNINVTSSDPTIVFVDSDNNSDFDIKAGGGRFAIRDSTNNAERVRIDSSGRIGIGENNPTRDIVIKKSGSVQVSLVGATNQNVFLNFGDTDDDNIGGINYDNTNNRLRFRANTNDAVQVKSNGNMAINDGDLEIGTSGHGISFAATSDASGMTSELLDDYEEGSFSPTLVNGNNGYRFQQGTYTKVGNLVTFTAYIETSATPPSGNLAFGNLPFTSIGSRSWVFPFHTNRTSFGTNSFDARAYMGGSDTNIYIYYPVNSSSSNFQPINQNGMNAANASAVWITGSYQTAS